jgi:hypothetical protein
MNTASTVIESELLDVAGEPLDVLIQSDDTWLRRAVDRIRDEASSVSADAAVAAFNSNI